MTEQRPNRTDPIRRAWMRFALVVAFGGALFVCTFVATPELWGMLLPETGSGDVHLPAPCPSPPLVASSVTFQSGGMEMKLPPGDWRPDTLKAGDAPYEDWRDARTGDHITIKKTVTFPGRPRIEHGDFHGITALERCREPAGAGSAWIASALYLGYGSFRVAIALVPTSDGRWIRVAAYTADGEARQRVLLAAVRTIRER